MSEQGKTRTVGDWIVSAGAVALLVIFGAVVAWAGLRWLIDGGWAYLAIGFCLLGWVLYLLKAS